MAVQTNREILSDVIKTIAPTLANPRLDNPTARDILKDMQGLADELKEVLE